MFKKISQKIDLPATLLLLVAMAAWSTTPLFIHQFSLDGLTVWDQGFYRYVIVMILIWPTVWLTKGHKKTKVKTLYLWKFALIPAMLAAGTQVFFSWSLYYLQPALMGVLHKQSIFWSILFAVIFFPDERNLLRKKIFWIGALCTFAGALGVVLLDPSFSATWARPGGTQWLGVLFVFIFSVCWGLYGVGVRKIIAITHPIYAQAIIMTYITIVLTILTLLFGRPFSIVDLSGRSQCLLILSAMVNLYFPFMAFFWIIARMGLVILQTSLLTTAYMTALFSWLIFKDTLSPGQWVSGTILLVGAGLVLTQQKLKKMRKKRVKPGNNG